MAANRHRKRRRRSGNGMPGWVWMTFGLAIGLAVAVAIHVKHRDDGPTTAPVAVVPPPAPAPPAEPASQQAPEVIVPASDENRFEFYELLPQFEVVVPETEVRARPDTRAAPPVEAPGSYVLQAGSFRRHEDADRMKASLALRGIESNIQRVQIDQDTFHRVRIGPIADLDELNRVRGSLREARIEAMLIRVPD